MFKINDNYLKLPGSYLFSTIAKKVNAYSEANPDKNIIRLPRQYTIKTRKRLIFKDFLGLLRAIYYPFTTFENLKN